MTKKTKKYEYAVIATDIVIFSIINEKLNVLLIKMKKKPFDNMWAAPGGLVDVKESLDKASERQLYKKTGVKNVYLQQYYTFGEVGRDPFGRVVSVAYFALIPSTGQRLKTSHEYEDIKWFPVDELPKLAYDHKNMIVKGIKKLQEKIITSNIVYSLLPKEFTLSELQRTYEIILKKNLDKRNFRKKILSLSLIVNTGEKQLGVQNRPAYLYKFINRKPVDVIMI